MFYSMIFIIFSSSKFYLGYILGKIKISQYCINIISYSLPSFFIFVLIFRINYLIFFT